MDISWFRVAHFQEHEMVLETPARVEQYYTILENPSFSPVGVLLRFYLTIRSLVPITPITLIYYHINVKKVTLHLYLVPNDCTVRKVTLMTTKEGPGWDGKNLEMQQLSPLDRFSTWSGNILL